LEADKYIEKVSALKIENLKAKVVNSTENCPEIELGYNDSDWPSLWKIQKEIQKANAVVYRGTISLPEDLADAKVNLFYNCIGNLQTVYINGEAISSELNKDEKERHTFQLDVAKLKAGKNEIAIVATPYKVKNSWDSPNTNPGVVQVIVPAKAYRRSLFSGYAQVIVQSTKEAGTIKLIAKSEGLEEAVLSIETKESENRAFVK
jgi:beta-galactosidase